MSRPMSPAQVTHWGLVLMVAGLAAWAMATRGTSPLVLIIPALLYVFRPPPGDLPPEE